MKDMGYYKVMIKQHWMPAVIVLQVILLIGMFWYVQSRLTLHETVINSQGYALSQVIDFLNKATATSTQQ